MKRNLFLLTILFGIFSYTSCKKDSILTEKDNIVIQNPYKSLRINNNIVEFDNVEHFHKTLGTFITIPEKDLFDFSKEIQFKSFLFEYYNVLIDLDKERIDLSDQRVSTYLDKDNKVSKNLKQSVVSSLINKDGILKIGSSIYYFDNLGQIIIKDGSLEKLKLSKIDRKEDKINGIYILDFKNSITDRAACGKLQSIVAYNGSSRRATMTSKLNYLPSLNQDGSWNIYVHDVHEGYPEKSSFWGGWRNYSADQNILELNYSVKLNNGMLFPNSHVSTNNWYVINYSRELINLPAVDPTLIGNFDGTFDYINVNRYKHLGMNGIWATIDCK